MPRRVLNVEVVKKSLRLRVGDLEYLQAAFPREGANGVIRRVISSLVDRHKAAAKESAVKQPTDLGDLID